MGRVSLSKVVLRNFRSFLGEHTVEFRDNSVVGVTSKNLDTGGESAAGKSSVLHAIMFALDCAPYSAKSFQSWHTEDPMGVELHLMTPEGPAVITRGRKLSITVNGTETTGNAKAVEAEIDRVTGVNARLRKALTYRPQKKPGLFLSLSDTEKKEFFVEVLGIQWAETLADTAIKAISTMEKEEGTLAAAHATAIQVYESVVSQAPLLVIHSLEEAHRRYVIADDCATSMKKAIERLEHERQEAAAKEERDVAAIEAAERPHIEFLEAKITVALRNTPVVEFDDTELKRLNGLLTECKRLRRDVEQEDRARFSEHHSRIATRKGDLQDLKANYAYRSVLQGELDEIDGQMTKLRESLCFTCMQIWVKATAKLAVMMEKRARLNVKIFATDALVPVIEQLEAEIKKESSVELLPNPELTRLDEIRRQLEAQITTEQNRRTSAQALCTAQAQTAIAELRAELGKVREQVSRDVAAIGRDPNRPLAKITAQLYADRPVLTAALMEEQAAGAELRRLKAENKASQDRAQQQIVAQDTAAAKVHAAAAALGKKQLELNAERDFLALLKGFLAAIFDDILAEITDETNVTLGKLPNVAHLTVRFVSDYQTAKGTVKQAIIPVVSFNGVEHPLDSGCSGGQESGIEVAVDLAVGRVVGRRTGSDLAFLLLDESFNGMDPITKEACLEVLAEYGKERLVLIVDHGSEMKEAVSQRIHVEFKAGKSWFVEPL